MAGAASSTHTHTPQIGTIKTTANPTKYEKTNLNLTPKPLFYNKTFTPFTQIVEEECEALQHSIAPVVSVDTDWSQKT